MITKALPGSTGIVERIRMIDYIDDRPGAFESALGRFRGVVAQTRERYSGDLVERVEGDGCAAWFRPAAGEDEPAVRAARAGIEIVRRVRGIDAETSRLDYDGKLSASVGIESGTVRSRADSITGAGRPIGDARAIFDYAARLFALADSSTVCVGPQAHRGVSKALPTTYLSALPRKGARGRIHVWRVDAQ